MSQDQLISNNEYLVVPGSGKRAFFWLPKKDEGIRIYEKCTVCGSGGRKVDCRSDGGKVAEIKRSNVVRQSGLGVLVNPLGRNY